MPQLDSEARNMAMGLVQASAGCHVCNAMLTCFLTFWLLTFTLFTETYTSLLLAYTYLPINRCVAGTKSNFLYTNCTAFETHDELVYVRVNPFRAARFVPTGNSLYAITVSWSDLTQERMCGSTADPALYTLYSKPNNLCTDSGTMTVSSSPFPLSLACNLFYAFLILWAFFGLFAGSLFDEHHIKRDPGNEVVHFAIGMGLVNAIALVAFFSSVYGMAFWENLSIRLNYLNPGVVNVAPIWDMNITNMGMNINSAGSPQVVYEVSSDYTRLVASPPLVSAFNSSGYYMYIICLAAVSFCILPMLIYFPGMTLILSFYLCSLMYPSAACLCRLNPCRRQKQRPEMNAVPRFAQDVERQASSFSAPPATPMSTATNLSEPVQGVLVI